MLKKAKPTLLKEGKFIRMMIRDGWEYVERANCTGVVIILAMTDKKEVIFISQYRIPVDKKVIEFPAGLINDKSLRGNESLSKAAQRELLEETGYRAQRIVKITEGPSTSGLSSDQLTVMRAFGLRKVARGGGDATESIRTYKVPLAKAETWLKKMQGKGFLVDPKIYAGLYFFAKN